MVDPISANPGKAIGAYLNTAKIADIGDAAATPATGGLSFGSLIKGAIEKVSETQKNSEAMSAKAVLGKAELTDVVKAVTDAELTLQTVVTVRDRMISAYQDIMRMPI